MLTFSFLYALALFAALQVESTFADGVMPNRMTPEEIKEVVEVHNYFRGSVNPSASNMVQMNWHEKAADNAQLWADMCNMLHSSYSLRGIPTSGCGENLYMSSHQKSWSHAIQAWYNEVDDWEYGKGSINGGVVGHLTQMVWYKSKFIGCAMAICPDSKYKYHYVCHYCPPGNYQLTHPYKSGNSCADCPNSCKFNLCTNVCDKEDMFSNCPAIVAVWGCRWGIENWCEASCKCPEQSI